MYIVHTWPAHPETLRYGQYTFTARDVIEELSSGDFSDCFGVEDARIDFVVELGHAHELRHVLLEYRVHAKH